MTNQEIRSTLAMFNFRGDDVFKDIAMLSGGERGRVVLTEVLLKQANFLILDEMNLSYVERYFSDFLSVMESEEGIPLMKNCIDKEITPVIKLPRNLFYNRTINVDETTYMFSP